MLGPRHLDPGSVTSARPGDNHAFLCTAPNEVAAEAILRKLAAQQIDCTTHRRVIRLIGERGRIITAEPVDLRVRGSDLPRARRIVS